MHALQLHFECWSPSVLHSVILLQTSDQKRRTKEAMKIKKPNQKQLQTIKRKFILLFNIKWSNSSSLRFGCFDFVSHRPNIRCSGWDIKNAPIAYLYENFLFFTSFIIIFVFIFVVFSPVGPFLIANIKWKLHMLNDQRKKDRKKKKEWIKSVHKFAGQTRKKCCWLKTKWNGLCFY